MDRRIGRGKEDHRRKEVGGPGSEMCSLGVRGEDKELEGQKDETIDGRITQCRWLRGGVTGRYRGPTQSWFWDQTISVSLHTNR